MQSVSDNRPSILDFVTRWDSQTCIECGAPIDIRLSPGPEVVEYWYAAPESFAKLCPEHVVLSADEAARELLIKTFVKARGVGILGKRCLTNGDCSETNTFCMDYYATFLERYCMKSQPIETAPECPSGNSSECDTGQLCVAYTNFPRCLVAA